MQENYNRNPEELDPFPFYDKQGVEIPNVKVNFVGHAFFDDSEDNFPPLNPVTDFIYLN